MKQFLIFAAIPLTLFIAFFGLPRIIAQLFNAHSDVGLIAILMLVCGLFSVIASKLYNATIKETNDHEQA
jgi:hypothetical protein